MTVPGNPTSAAGWLVPLAVGLVVEQVAALAHPSRRRIYEHLLRLPGDHFRAIARALRMGVSSARHHLAVLVRTGLVYAERAEGRCRYYPRGEAITAQVTGLYRKHWKYRDLRFRVLLAVHAVREAQPATVARALGISRQLAAYHLARLTKQGKVVVREGRYRPRGSSRPEAGDRGNEP
jgi:predicted transcriptional regulator